MTLFLLLFLCVTGTCNGCRAGQFFDKNQCKPCPGNCAYCVSETTCSLCKSGYHGESCSLVCSNCEAETACDTNTGYCINSCKEGLSGEHCNITCNPQCNSCDRINHNECIICALDRHGIFCNNTCSSTCLKGLCNDTDGFCTYGCSIGYWGQTCEDTCSSNCKNVACTIHNGTCVEGCEDGYYEYNCSKAHKKHFQWYIPVIPSVMLIIIVVPIVAIVCYIKRDYLSRRFNLFVRNKRNSVLGIPQGPATNVGESEPMLDAPQQSNDRNPKTSVTSRVVNDESEEEPTDAGVRNGFPFIAQDVEMDMNMEGVTVQEEMTPPESNNQNQNNCVTRRVVNDESSEVPTNNDGANDSATPTSTQEHKKDNYKEDNELGTNVDTGLKDTGNCD